jgi:SOS-response transcriptional repressor LexA
VKVEADETWRHEKIILEPLNPEYSAWELEENSPIKVIGEFVTVLENH